jgi:hypothetical protein
VISHTNVICNYLANKYDLVCNKENEHDVLLTHMIVEQLRECETDQIQIFRESDPLTRVELYNKLLGETLPRTLAGLDKILSANKQSKYIVGSKITWVDLMIVNDVEWLDDVCKKKISSYSCLSAYYSFVRSLPTISDWYAKQKPLGIFKNV